MKSVSFFASLALLSLFVLLSTGGLGKAQAQQASEKARIEDTKQAIKVLDDLVRNMDKAIAVTQEHKRKLLELRKALVKGKTSEKTFKVAGVGQETGWLIEHPAQAIGKVYDKYKEAEKAVKEHNEANERWLEKQKEAKEQQEKEHKK